MKIHRDGLTTRIQEYAALKRAVNPERCGDARSTCGLVMLDEMDA